MVIHRPPIEPIRFALSFVLPVVSNRDSSLQGLPSSIRVLETDLPRFFGAHQMTCWTHMTQNCHDIFHHFSYSFHAFPVYLGGDKGIQFEFDGESTCATFQSPEPFKPRNGLKIFDANGAFRCCNYAQHDWTPQISGSSSQISSYICSEGFQSEMISIDQLFQTFHQSGSWLSNV